jgi:hypothetical protein
VCLDPSTQVLKLSNAIHYNLNPTSRRRRNPPTTSQNLSIPCMFMYLTFCDNLVGSNILPVLQSARKQDHSLLNFLTASGWKLSPSNVAGRNRPTTRKQKQSSKAKKVWKSHSILLTRSAKFCPKFPKKD